MNPTPARPLPRKIVAWCTAVVALLVVSGGLGVNAFLRTQRASARGLQARVMGLHRQYLSSRAALPSVAGEALGCDVHAGWQPLLDAPWFRALRIASSGPLLHAEGPLPPDLVVVIAAHTPELAALDALARCTRDTADPLAPAPLHRGLLARQKALRLLILSTRLQSPDAALTRLVAAARLSQDLSASHGLLGVGLDGSLAGLWWAAAERARRAVGAEGAVRVQPDMERLVGREIAEGRMLAADQLWMADRLAEAAFQSVHLPHSRSGLRDLFAAPRLVRLGDRMLVQARANLAQPFPTRAVLTAAIEAHHAAEAFGARTGGGDSIYHGALRQGRRAQCTRRCFAWAVGVRAPGALRDPLTEGQTLRVETRPEGQVRCWSVGPDGLDQQGSGDDLRCPDTTPPSSPRP